ncbi:MAG TPA: serine/threonine-protein kinase, partial [Kofleriaceae bacterium]
HLTKVGVTAAESVALVRRIGQALAPAHARGLVHRDLKPANILLVGGDVAQPKVIDFGLARRGFGDSRLTETGTAVGTPSFMSPEQARGERELDPRTDSFALGCLLYECLTGMPAFGGRNAAAIMARIVMCEPPALRASWFEAPPELEAVVAQLLAKDRDGRPADGAAVAALLDSIEVPATERRRRLDSGTLATEVGETATYVIFVQADELDEPAIRGALEPFGARIERLLDGALVAVLQKDAATAARCALALRRCLPTAAIVVAGPQGDESAAQLTKLFDAAGAALEVADLGQIFESDLDPSAIRIDSATAARLRGTFVIEQDRNAVFLLGERGAS